MYKRNAFVQMLIPSPSLSHLPPLGYYGFVTQSWMVGIVLAA